jgi:hypothetical protein
MLIGDNYKIESDNLNVTLYEKKLSKNTRKVYWRPFAYFSTVKNALAYFIELSVNETGLKDLKTVVKKQDELLALVKALEIGQSSVTACKAVKKRL